MKKGLGEEEAAKVSSGEPFFSFRFFFLAVVVVALLPFHLSNIYLTVFFSNSFSFSLYLSIHLSSFLSLSLSLSSPSLSLYPPSSLSVYLSLSSSRRCGWLGRGRMLRPHCWPRLQRWRGKIREIDRDREEKEKERMEKGGDYVKGAEGEKNKERI